MGPSENSHLVAPAVDIAPARPFLRWAGSKHRLLDRILPYVPKTFGTYFEPFLGSGALYFALKPKNAVLSDASEELIATWLSVRDDVDYICKYLAGKQPSRDLFYSIRKVRALSFPERAAEFIYLNKTCWNGLYRVNSRGEFNVPYGAPKTGFIFDESVIRACSILIGGAGVSISVSDFEQAIQGAVSGDLVFLDPPYVTKHNHNGFRDWNQRLFTWKDQERLADAARNLVDKGVQVIVSNADHPDVIALYRDFSFYQIGRSSSLSANPAKRGPVTEALFVSI